jgi:hypothetical protein
MTAMGCPGTITKLETAYLKALETVTHFSVGSTLQLTGAGVALTYEREPASPPTSASS